MSTLQIAGHVLPGADAPFIWERQARPAMESIAAPGASPARARRRRQRRIRQVDDAARAAPAARSISDTRRRHTRRLPGRLACAGFPRAARRRPASPRREAGRAHPHALRGSGCRARRRESPVAAHRRADQHHAQPRAEPARDRARTRVALGCADLSRRSRPGDLELVHRPPAGSSPGACRGSSPRRSRCTTSGTASTTAVIAPSCAPWRTASRTGWTRSPPSCVRRSRHCA